ncbi:MAG: oxygenase MpaB family protein [Myxococcota bacterium]
MWRTETWEARIDALDPDEDAATIVRILFDHVFTEDYLHSVELGQLTTFGIPSISRVLHGTRQYEDDSRKRLDDTLGIGLELFGGFDKPEVGAMIEHLNEIHSFYPITNDDNLYTLTTLYMDLDFWLVRFGHRQLRERERRALHNFGIQLGSRMGITDIPETYDAMKRWRQAYEARCQRYHPDNEAVTRGAIRGLCADVPRPLHWLVPSIIATVIDDDLRRALGLKRAAWPIRTTVLGVMRARRALRRRFNLHQRRPYRDARRFHELVTYPDGYEPLQLGPPKVLRAMAKRRGTKAGHGPSVGCPVHRTARPATATPVGCPMHTRSATAVLATATASSAGDT